MSQSIRLRATSLNHQDLCDGVARLALSALGGSQAGARARYPLTTVSSITSDAMHEVEVWSQYDIESDEYIVNMEIRLKTHEPSTHEASTSAPTASGC
jgi:hypothetical protein